MVGRSQAHGIRGLGIFDGEFGRVDRRHDLVRKQQRDSARGRLGKHEDRRVDQAFSQLDALVDRGDAQVVGTGVQRRLRNAHRAVAVCVGLHNGHHVTARADHLLDGGSVVTNGVQIDFKPGPATILFRDGGQLLGVELHAALGVFAVCRISGRRFLAVAVVLERAARLIGGVGCGLALGQEAGHPATRRLRRRRLTGMSRALGFALADGVRRAGTARRLAERETGETVGKLSIVCHVVLHPLETIALPECAGRRSRRRARRVSRIADTSISLGKCGNASAQTLQIPAGSRQSTARHLGTEALPSENEA